ncbi:MULTISPECIES: PEP-utilizing enzyme [unclassified Rhodococcus (in: high G+C Gram-positive bacteria)]|uniref:PEP-utilizing enzyme n=1 Tax=unclassified Rhodococcus (in: high G+C Gram-positive bacteria) TaxID=192944 RepID=UPI00163A7A72|nr:MULTISPECIES: PEP-utilizing enzyme [unclassified Rhodococcus (in: high G+C Gram-positive bacteria)]MBC2637624.1 phosphoenolpyruvate-utilizing protein [Rhodococcus sp. 3A]MBC2897632.1 phosphoenolpyruvate-utilizing protein [Rhodococcus sp. 4CII]
MEKIWPCDDDASERFPIFTRANTGEVFVDAATPLTWSVYGRGVYENGYRDALYRIGAFTAEDFRPEGEGEVVGCFGGYVYINVSASRVLAVRAPGMTWEAIDQSFFGDQPDVPPYQPNPLDENPECTARMGEWMNSLFTATSLPEIDEHRRHIDRVIAERPDLTTLTDAELLARFRDLVPQMRKIFSTHMVQTYGSNIVTGTIAQAAAAAGRPELVSSLTAGVGNVDSVVQSIDIWNLSRLANAPAVAAEFDKGIDDVVARLETSESQESTKFLEAWRAFIRQWGYLGPSIWELRSPTYEQNPEIPLKMIDRARGVPDSGSPEIRARRLEHDRLRAVTVVAELLDGAELHDAFLAAANVVPLYMPAREAIKVQCTRMLEEARKTMRELGGRLTEAGTLERWQDVLLLMDDEIDDFVDDPAPWKDTVAARKEKLTLIESLTPPFVFSGTPPMLDQFTPRNAASTTTAAEAGTVLTGIGASPGTHTGRARIITSLDDESDFESGDVLIARTTDSSWGPLFLTAGAIVCETGAAISHAAIVSRELGLPSAVSVPDATSRIPGGTIVTVNGDDGTVLVH